MVEETRILKSKLESILSQISIRLIAVLAIGLGEKKRKRSIEKEIYKECSQEVLNNGK